MYDIKVISAGLGHVIHNAVVQIAYRGYSISMTENETRVFNGPDSEDNTSAFQTEGCNIDTIHQAMACIDRLVDDPVPYPRGSVVRFVDDDELWLIDAVSARGLYSVVGHENYGNGGSGSAWHEHKTVELVNIPTADTWHMLQEAAVLDEDEDEIELSEFDESDESEVETLITDLEHDSFEESLSIAEDADQLEAEGYSPERADDLARAGRRTYSKKEQAELLRQRRVKQSEGILDSEDEGSDPGSD